MATVPVVAGQYNTFVPSAEATNNMVVGFSRDPKKFALPNYVQYVPVKLNAGRYWRVTAELAGRILNTDLQDFAWPDGVDAPSGTAGRETFGLYGYTTQRLAFPFSLGEIAADQASWDILAFHARIHMQRCMTARTQAVYNVLSTSGNYDGQTSAVGSISGVAGQHDLSTTARKDIKKTFDYMADQIRKSTLGAVEPQDLHVVVGPDWARKVASGQEIVDHVKHSPAAREELEKGLAPNTRYGLPTTLYGYNIHVEDAVKVTSRRGATAVKTYIWDGDNVVMLARPGELEGVEGAPSFSACTLFMKEENTVEQKHDRDNRVHKGRVVDDYDVVMTAPAAAFLATNALS